MTASMSLAQARRITLAAQGFGADRNPDGTATKPAMRRMIEQLGVLQIDSVNVLARAHTLPLFSRLGRYATSDLDSLAYNGQKRALFEYWGHEASLLPVALQPLFRWRMARAEANRGIYTGLASFGRDNSAFITSIRREIETRGPVSAQELGGVGPKSGGWWGWSESKRAVEWLFWAGHVSTVTRRPTFERVYDLTERVIPAAILAQPTPDEAEAHRQLLTRAASALGVATATCLRDYYRLKPGDASARLAELVEAGTLTPVTVEGWKDPAYLSRGARVPRRMNACALLVPFDPLIWQRGRAEHQFGARIRLELYTPKEKRTHGYYVLPFLLGDRIVARVDLKADRATATLQVLASHAEPLIPHASIAAPLAAELQLMAAWLGLENVAVSRRGDLATTLKRVI
jgi:uncharacterized protein